ncbi:unnamed protein product [Periconia digitata]|uniref:Enoyl reductase (ER) domain-containing protein n=1 Tax=Periconia digitata TaxID=1303443 RepID=A0A9W4UEK7_9PLEO|nr:unnamed protein product [Periconia digitata]
MKAVKIISPGEAKVITDVPNPPRPSSDNILVKIFAIALNPHDWKELDYGEPSTLGLDLAGIVEDLGPDVTNGFKKGDRVFGITHGGNKLRPHNGAFSEYATTREGVLIPIPEGKSFEEAVSGGIGLLTVGQGMYQEMALSWPNAPLKEKQQILIWGGSSATGALGIQFAKLSGYEVITTCSTNNFDYVKSLGADHVFDSRSPSTGNDIRVFTNNQLRLAWDTIGEHGSPESCGAALTSEVSEGKPIRYGTIVGGNPVREGEVINTLSTGYTVVGEDVEAMGRKIPAMPKHYDFIKEWFVLVEQLYRDGKFKMHRLDVRQGGFEGIVKGLQDLKAGKVSGAKVVYRVGS